MTGVQTCALPICMGLQVRDTKNQERSAKKKRGEGRAEDGIEEEEEIGRASCRERV